MQRFFLPNHKDPRRVGSNLDLILAQGRERILTILLRVTSVLGIVGILSIMGNLLKDGRWDLVVVYLSGMVVIGLISYLPRIPYPAKAIAFLTIIFLLGIIDLSHFGVAEDWRLYFTTFTILATVFLGWRVGVLALFSSLIAFVAIAWQISVGQIVITASAIDSPVPNLEAIITFSLVLVLANGVIIAAITALLHEYELANLGEQQAVMQLGQRTKELEHALIREQHLAHEVASALQQEEELSHLRSKIITTISHEFRTPLTVINNSANLLDKYYDRLSPEKRQEQYGRIHTAIHYLTDLLKDISLVDEAKNDAIYAQQTPIRYSDFCQRLQTDLLQSLNNPANLHFEIATTADAKLLLDYNLLKQLITNLLNNAVKYSPPDAPIHLKIAHDTVLTISVKDQGIGIPDDEKEKIWDPFYRGRNVETRSGLGLGLYIIKQMLNIMSGTITLEDNPDGQGVVFTIQLPLQLSAPH